jgi:hypothetical protein
VATCCHNPRNKKERPRVHAGPSSQGYSPRGGYFEGYHKINGPA